MTWIFKIAMLTMPCPGSQLMPYTQVTPRLQQQLLLHRASLIASHWLVPPQAHSSLVKKPFSKDSGPSHGPLRSERGTKVTLVSQSALTLQVVFWGWSCLDPMYGWPLVSKMPASLLLYGSLPGVAWICLMGEERPFPGIFLLSEAKSDISASVTLICV